MRILSMINDTIVTAFMSVFVPDTNLVYGPVRLETMKAKMRESTT